jgi:hypothetical protein
MFDTVPRDDGVNVTLDVEPTDLPFKYNVRVPELSVTATYSHELAVRVGAVTSAVVPAVVWISNSIVWFVNDDAGVKYKKFDELEPNANTGCVYDEPPAQSTHASAVNAVAPDNGFDGNAAYEDDPLNAPDKLPGNGPVPPSVIPSFVAL